MKTGLIISVWFVERNKNMNDHFSNQWNKEVMKMCEHKRVYTWLAFDPIEGDLLCCGCLDCHNTWTKVLKSIARLTKDKLAKDKS